MDAANLFPTPKGLMATHRRRTTCWPGVPDQGPVAGQKLDDDLARRYRQHHRKTSIIGFEGEDRY